MGYDCQTLGLEIDFIFSIDYRLINLFVSYY